MPPRCLEAHPRSPLWPFLSNSARNPAASTHDHARFLTRFSCCRSSRDAAVFGWGPTASVGAADRVVRTTSGFDWSADTGCAEAAEQERLFQPSILVRTEISVESSFAGLSGHGLWCMSVPKLSQVNLAVRDMEAMADFYIRLGLPLAAQSPAWAAHHRSAASGEAPDIELDSVAFTSQWNEG